MNERRLPNHLNENEVKDCVYEIETKDRKVLVDKQNPVETTYTMLGYQDDTDDNGNPLLFDVDKDNLAKNNDFACALKVEKGQNTTYFIRRGASTNKMLNLKDFLDEYSHNRELKHLGRKAYEWKKVSYNAFNIYLSFLRTKNMARLSLAEREAL